MSSIKNVLICGGGLMGKNIAFVVLFVKEHHIMIYDVRLVDVKAGDRDRKSVV